ncbi:glycoside hydrolase family 3 protein [Kineococcus glutinatus]|uniref:beta-glucosidase n=1 Tax=Kineococcus glutinatus TaxID=1070872 RepID=A0ABP9HMI1_9ACTN
MSTPTTTTAPYRDPGLPVAARVEDLLARMSLEEKAGLLFHTMLTVGPGGSLPAADPAFGLPSAEEMVLGRGMTHFNLLGAAPTAQELARWHNALQELAAQTRLGIPVTVSTDPRSAFTDNPGTAAMAGPFSQWPETLGLAAVGDAGLVERFADTVRREYLAVGLRVALHPQVDLATEPRWSRIGGTFGEDAELTSRLVVAYVRGFQGERLGPGSVATMVKHFPGGGPQLDGEDPHFAYGREQVYPGGNFEHHLLPFEAAFAAGASQVMPYYGMPVGTRYEEVGFGFNRDVVTGLLRERYGFDGIVCADWGLLTDSEIMGQPMPARAWGVEHLTPLERAAKALDAGVDQFGGEARPELVVELVRSGRISAERLDVSVRRLLREKFVLGLFDDPFVDEGAAGAVVGRADFRAAGEAAQRAAVTVLTNTPAGPREVPVLPLPRGARLYLEGVDPAAVGDRAVVVASPEEADVAVVRLEAPYEPRPGAFEAFFHAGSLEFPAAERERVVRLCRTVPTVVDVHLDRPAVLPEVAAAAAALVVTFGSSDAALLDVLLGDAAGRGRLPFDLPSSTAAVVASRTDVPFDTADPLFRCGHGLDLAPTGPTAPATETAADTATRSAPA